MALPYAASLESDLLARIRAGDQEAFEEVFRRHYGNLCFFAARMGAAPGVAEEIVQDVFFRIWEHREQLDITGTLLGYLYAAVRNRTFNYREHSQLEQRWRARKQAEIEHTAPVAPEADEDIRVAELALAVERAVAELPPRTRQTFLLRRQHHLSYAEIARIMEVSQKTVEIQVGAALKALRKALAEWMEPDTND